MFVLRVVMRVELNGSPGAWTYEDPNFAGRSGWREIVVVPGSGVHVTASTHDATDHSLGLTEYPVALIASPPGDTRATFHWARGTGSGGAATSLPRHPTLRGEAGPALQRTASTDGRKDYLSALLGRSELTPWMVIAGMAVAFGLGAVHALSPGHGKAIVAACSVPGRNGDVHSHDQRFCSWIWCVVVRAIRCARQGHTGAGRNFRCVHRGDRSSAVVSARPTTAPASPSILGA